ncbi:MAG: dihydrolipoamide acetyltransferase family protein [Chloroflexota bacterium]
MYEFKLPDVGEGIHEAEVLQWLVNVGDPVSLDQPMLEIQTDKAVVEIPAPVEGTISEIVAEAGAMVRVGELLVVIEPASEQAGPARDQHNGSQGSRAGLGGPKQRVLAAPAVRKLALEFGVDLTQVTGSGPAGRILPEDVKRARLVQEKAGGKPVTPVETATPGTVKASPAARPTPAPPLPTGREITAEEELRGLRRRIAERMERAWQIPHVASFEEVDATNLIALREHLKPEAESRGCRLTYLPFIIKATVQALKEFPYLNASLDMERQKILIHRYYHIGIATAVPEGLLVPVIRHADQMNLLQLAAELNRLTELAQQRKLGLEELAGSTFTITNFGSFGTYQGTPIINPPEAAILGCGRITQKAAVVQGQVEARPVLPLALSFDHRLIDGALAGRFLERLRALLADPKLLLLELV